MAFTNTNNSRKKRRGNNYNPRYRPIAPLPDAPFVRATDYEDVIWGVTNRRRKNPKLPKISFTYSASAFGYNTCFTSTVQLAEESPGPASYNWMFNDGDANSVSTETNPCHIFPGPGTYPVTLLVRDEGLGLEAQTTLFVTVGSSGGEGQPSAGFDYTVTAISGCGDDAQLQWTATLNEQTRDAAGVGHELSTNLDYTWRYVVGSAAGNSFGPSASFVSSGTQSVTIRLTVFDVTTETNAVLERTGVVPAPTEQPTLTQTVTDNDGGLVTVQFNPTTAADDLITEITFYLIRVDGTTGEETASTFDVYEIGNTATALETGTQSYTITATPFAGITMGIPTDETAYSPTQWKIGSTWKGASGICGSNFTSAELGITASDNETAPPTNVELSEPDLPQCTPLVLVQEHGAPDFEVGVDFNNPGEYALLTADWTIGEAGWMPESYEWRIDDFNGVPGSFVTPLNDPTEKSVAVQPTTDTRPCTMSIILKIVDSEGVINEVRRKLVFDADPLATPVLLGKDYFTRWWTVRPTNADPSTAAESYEYEIKTAPTQSDTPQRPANGVLFYDSTPFNFVDYSDVPSVYVRNVAEKGQGRFFLGIIEGSASEDGTATRSDVVEFTVRGVLGTEYENAVCGEQVIDGGSFKAGGGGGPGDLTVQGTATQESPNIFTLNAVVTSGDSGEAITWNWELPDGTRIPGKDLTGVAIERPPNGIEDTAVVYALEDTSGRTASADAPLTRQADYTIAIQSATVGYADDGLCGRTLNATVTASGAEATLFQPNDVEITFTTESGYSKTISGTSNTNGTVATTEDFPEPGDFAQGKVVTVAAREITGTKEAAPVTYSMGAYPLSAATNLNVSYSTTDTSNQYLRILTDGAAYGNPFPDDANWEVAVGNMPVDVSYEVTDPFGTTYTLTSPRPQVIADPGLNNYVYYKFGQSVEVAQPYEDTNNSNRLTIDRREPFFPVDPNSGGTTVLPFTVTQTVTDKCGASDTAPTPTVFVPTPPEPPRVTTARLVWDDASAAPDSCNRNITFTPVTTNMVPPLDLLIENTNGYSELRAGEMVSQWRLSMPLSFYGTGLGLPDTIDRSEFILEEYPPNRPYNFYQHNAEVSATVTDALGRTAKSIKRGYQGPRAGFTVGNVATSPFNYKFTINSGGLPHHHAGSADGSKVGTPMFGIDPYSDAIIDIGTTKMILEYTVTDPNNKTVVVGNQEIAGSTWNAPGILVDLNSTLFDYGAIENIPPGDYVIKQSVFWECDPSLVATLERTFFCPGSPVAPVVDTEATTASVVQQGDGTHVFTWDVAATDANRNIVSFPVQFDTDGSGWVTDVGEEVTTTRFYPLQGTVVLTAGDFTPITDTNTGDTYVFLQVRVVDATNLSSPYTEIYTPYTPFTAPPP